MSIKTKTPTEQFTLKCCKCGRCCTRAFGIGRVALGSTRMNECHSCGMSQHVAHPPKTLDRKEPSSVLGIGRIQKGGKKHS